MRNSDMIGGQIRSIREARGYSQEYMAEMLGTCQSTYANLESGKSNMSVQRLLHITEILNINIHQLFDQYRDATPTKESPRSDSMVTAGTSSLDAETKRVYDQLIYELRNEIDFLRSLILHQRDRA